MCISFGLSSLDKPRDVFQRISTALTLSVLDGGYVLVDGLARGAGEGLGSAAVPVVYQVR